MMVITDNMPGQKTSWRSDTMESLDSDVDRIVENGDQTRQLPMQGKEIQLREVKFKMAVLHRLYKWRFDIGS